MIKIFKTMLNGKMAGIQTSDGLSDIFRILVGVAQGDSPSGVIFLLAVEPLLWKINTVMILRTIICCPHRLLTTLLCWFMERLHTFQILKKFSSILKSCQV